MKQTARLILLIILVTEGFSITQEDTAAQQNGSPSYIYFESKGDESNELESFQKKLMLMLQKPTYKWTIPNTLSSHPSSCDEYTYCEREDRPAEGVYRRLPIYPWWYYSCEGNKVKCKPCPTTQDLDHPTLFFSERCQQCISQYKDERIACPPKKDEV